MTWTRDTKIPDHYATYGIGLAVLPDNRIICVHRGDGSDARLWWTEFKNGAWGQDILFPRHYGANGASLAMYGGVLHCVHRGGVTDDNLWFCTFDAARNSWSADQKLPDVRCSRNPAIASYRNAQGKELLYCVHRGWQTDDALYVTTYDGHGWTRDAPIGPGEHRCAGDVALAVFGNKLYCVHSGRAPGNSLWMCTFDGTAWSNDEALPDHHAIDLEQWGTIALASDGRELYCLHRGGAFDQSIWETCYNGGTWSIDKKLPDHYARSLAATVHDGALVCVHSGSGEDHALYSTSRTLPTAAEPRAPAQAQLAGV